MKLSERLADVMPLTIFVTLVSAIVMLVLFEIVSLETMLNILGNTTPKETANKIEWAPITLLILIGVLTFFTKFIHSKK